MKIINQESKQESFIIWNQNKLQEKTFLNRYGLN